MKQKLAHECFELEFSFCHVLRCCYLKLNAVLCAMCQVEVLGKVPAMLAAMHFMTAKRIVCQDSCLTTTGQKSGESLCCTLYCWGGLLYTCICMQYDYYASKKKCGNDK